MSERLGNKGRIDYKKMSSHGLSDNDLLGAGGPALGKDAEKKRWLSE